MFAPKLDSILERFPFSSDLIDPPPACIKKTHQRHTLCLHPGNKQN